MNDAEQFLAAFTDIRAVLADMQTKLDRIEADTKHLRPWRILLGRSRTMWPLDKDGQPTGGDIVWKEGMWEPEARKLFDSLKTNAHGLRDWGYLWRNAALLDSDNRVASTVFAPT